MVRVVVPLVRSLAVHRLHVIRVDAGAPGVVSVEIGGRRLEALGARSGQYFHWRFLAPGHRRRARALSLSAAPDGRRLRVTARERTGGGAPSLATLPAGTRVIAEGPAGGVTSAARQRPRVVLIAGGPGLAPARALLEDMPGGPGDIALVAVGDREDAPFGPELDALARRRGAGLHWLAGDDLTAERLRALVPDVAERDVFVSGPTGMVEGARAALREAGVAARQISSEGFGP
jgi:ferredoxin-NADP reductase